MPSTYIIDVQGSYVNGEIFNNSWEELGDTSVVSNRLFNFVNNCRSTLKTFSIINCYDDTGLPSLSGSLAELFQGCSNLTEIDFLCGEGYVTNISNMFYNCYNLTSFNAPNWNMSNVTNMTQVFRDCRNITSLNLSNWNTENTTSINRIFYNCYNLTSLNLSNWKTNNIIDSYGTFGNCRKLTSINISDWNFNSMESIGLMFYNCINLTSLNLSNWQVSNITNMLYLFRDCHNLKTIHINPNNWKLNSSLVSGDMFINCYNLLGRKGTTYVSSKTDASYARVDEGPELPGYFCGIYNAAVSNIPIKDAYFRGQKVNKAILGRDLLDLKKKLISFTIEGIEYKAEKEMTWREWVASEYNTGGYTINESNPISDGGPYLQSTSGLIIMTRI